MRVGTTVVTPAVMCLLVILSHTLGLCVYPLEEVGLALAVTHLLEAFRESWSDGGL